VSKPIDSGDMQCQSGRLLQRTGEQALFVRANKHKCVCPFVCVCVCVCGTQ